MKENGRENNSQTSFSGSVFTGTQKHTFIDEDYIKGDIKWGVYNMETLAEFQTPTVATAEHLVGYRLRLAQQGRRWILECHSVHLGQLHRNVPIVCKHITTN